MTLLDQQTIDALRKVLDRRARVEVDLVPQRVLGRNPDGTIRLLRQDAACELRGGITANYSGQVIHGPPSPTFSRRGLGGSTLSGLGSRAAIWVERLEPERLLRGSITTVTVIGRGFRAETVFEFGEPFSRNINPEVVILDSRFIDSTTYELDVEIAVDARLVEHAPLFYDNP